MIYAEIDYMVKNPPRGFKKAIANVAINYGFGGFV